MLNPVKLASARLGTRDYVIAGIFIALGVLLMVLNATDPPPRPEDEQAAVHIGNLIPYFFVVPLFLAVTVPLIWRRVAPLAAVAATLAGLLVNEALLGTEVVRCGVLLPVSFLLAYNCGANLDRREALIGFGGIFVLIMVGAGLELDPVIAFVGAGVAGVTWAIGRLVRSRKQMAVELEARSGELRVARDERARMEVSADRARLSGELDELLQRRLSELAAMAERGAAAPASDSSAAALAEIEHASRQTLEDMRALVGELRDEEGAVLTKPQPTLTHLQALLVRAKGGDARLVVEGNPRVLPPAVELSAYRIVEHLLEALRDAPDLTVRIRFADDSLELAVAGPAKRGAKVAIERARERARLERGTLEATLRGGHADAVVSLPVAVPA